MLGMEDIKDTSGEDDSQVGIKSSTGTDEVWEGDDHVMKYTEISPKF